MVRLTMAASVMALCASGAGHAQTVDPARQVGADATVDMAGGGEEIVVTAQRRAESVQKVPIAITVVGSEALKTNNFVSLADAQYLAPSLKFIDTPAAPSFSIRGVGSQAYDFSIEQAVGIALDDVIQGLPRINPLNTLADVERIEVLRGPQGTLFGKNTSSGLISITTKRPVLNEYSLEGRAQYGSRNDLQVYNIINVPLSDTLAGRFRASYQIRDVVYDNRGPAELPNTRNYAFNGKLLWEPTDRLSAYFIADYQNSRGVAGLISIRSFGQGSFAPAVGNSFIRDTQTALGIVPGPENRSVAQGVESFQDSEAWSAQLTLSLELGAHALTSVTAYKDAKYQSVLEADSSPLTFLDNNRVSIDSNQFTQEFRLSSPVGEAFEYTLGAFYYRMELKSAEQQSGGLGFLPDQFPIDLSITGGLLNYGNTTESIAGFGEVAVRPFDRLRIFAGGRYTHDKITSSVFVSELPNVCGLELLVAGVCHAVTLPTAPASGTTSRGDYTARAGIEFQATPDVMAYATIARGYKGAGFATVSGALRPVQPETVVSGEVGLKSQFFNRRLTVNLNAFYSDYKDFQTQVYDASVPPAGSFVTGNAGGLRTRGFEAELALRPTRDLSITGGLAYTDAEFTDYQPACYPGQTAAQGCTLAGPTFDARGFPLPNAPKWTYNIGANYEPAIGNDLVGLFAANYAYRSSAYHGVGDPSTIHPGYGVLNASVGIGTADGAMRLRLFAQNLTKQNFVAQIVPTYFDIGGYAQVLTDAAQRRFGASLDYRF